MLVSAEPDDSAVGVGVGVSVAVAVAVGSVVGLSEGALVG